MTRVLLVTGSRSLADHPGAEAWARGLIHAALIGVDLLIVGDAPGPDAWAAEIASSHDKRVRRYDTHGVHAGWIVEAQYDLWCPVARWATPAMEGRRFPLHRNEAMVRDVASLAMTRQWSAHVLALLDGTKRDAPGRRATRGTEHTAGLAERAGLSVQREVWRGR